MTNNKKDKEKKMKTNMDAMVEDHELNEWISRAYTRGREFERDRIVNILMKSDVDAKIDFILTTFWSADDDH
jgi:hypothetical protein